MRIGLHRAFFFFPAVAGFVRWGWVELAFVVALDNGGDFGEAAIRLHQRMKQQPFSSVLFGRRLLLGPGQKSHLEGVQKLQLSDILDCWPCMVHVCLASPPIEL